MAHPFALAGSASTAMPATKVEISVSCRKLKDEDLTSKSDPMCVLFTKGIGQDTYYEVGRTEVIKDALDPDFVKKFVMDYFFEESQKLKFEIYDSDSEKSKLKEHDFLGRMECTLGQIFGASCGKLEKKLEGISTKSKSTITVRAEELANSKEAATIQLSGVKLDKKDFLGKSDPFLVISRGNADGSFTVVHKTEVIKNDLNPTWRSFTLKVQALCQGDYSKPLKFDCYDWDSDGDHDLIGSFTSTFAEISKGTGHFDLINQKKHAKKGKGYKNSGVIHVMSCKIQQIHSFLDFIQGGMEVNFTVAVDFTASNGDPRTPKSLHYFNPHHPNEYSMALSAIGGVVQDYDSDKMVPALGFGAKMPDGQILHEFFLNGNPSNPYCFGIAGVLEAYQRTLGMVQLWGPTNFSPCINHVARFAASYTDGSRYFILLILTDGVITDMAETKHAIIRASSLPLSVIIVGVGNADFTAMEELDDLKTKSSQRDIVQFVPFREIMSKHRNNLQMSQAFLAKEVLAEVPGQVTGYMSKMGLKPRPPQQPGTAGQPAPPGPAGAPFGQAPYPNQAPPPTFQQQPPQGWSPPPAGVAGQVPPQGVAPYPGANQAPPP